MHAWDQDGSGRQPAQPGVALRDSRPGDEVQMLHLWRELMDLHVGLDDRFALSENADEAFLSYAETARSRDDYHVKLAIYQDQPVGFAISCILPNSPVYQTRWIGYVNDLCVTRAMRGRGVGQLLVKDAVTWLRENGADSVEVYVARANEIAQSFWRKVGGREYLDRFSLDLSMHED